MTDTIGHAHTQTRPASLRRHPIITAPKWTTTATTAAMAAGTGLNAHGRPVLPVAGEGRMPGIAEFSSTSATSSAAPAGVLCCDGVAPNACPQLGTPFTLHGNKRVAVGAPDARWGGGNAWRPLHFNAIADAMGSCLGSTHGNISSCLRNLNCKAQLLLLLLLL